MYFCLNQSTSTFFYMMKKTLLLLLAMLLLTGTFFSCQQPQPIQPVSFVGEAQGTYYLVTYYDDTQRDLQPQVDSLLRAIDLSVSLWEPQSILTRINKGDTSVKPDDIFMYNFILAKEVAIDTDGAFDFTIAPLVKAWGFGPNAASEMSPKLIDSLIQLVDHRKVRIENGTVVKDDPRISFDFNAIAKGHSVDLVANLLKRNGIERFIVDIGGEIYASAAKPDGSAWQVGIEQPADNRYAERKVSDVILLQDKGIATSGSYRRYYEKNGLRYSHTIDPQTGKPVSHSLLSVTVLADNVALADAYATAFMVMGHEKAIAMVNSRTDLDAHFIWSVAGGGFETYTTEGLRALIKE